MEKSILKDLLITGTPYPPKEELEHFNNCDGCPRCDYMMEFFGQCVQCSNIIDKKHLYYDHPVGDYYCDDCVKEMPNKNTNEFVSCGACLKRYTTENMFKNHKNFDTAWTCIKCVAESIINNRFEILDL